MTRSTEGLFCGQKRWYKDLGVGATGKQMWADPPRELSNSQPSPKLDWQPWDAACGNLEEVKL